MDRVNNGAEVDAAVRTQPLLVIGLGGQGHRAVLNLKSHLASVFGRVPDGVRLLVIDIDQENLSVTAGERTVRLVPEHEVFCIGPIPVASIRKHLGNWPTIEQRLAPALRAIPWVAVANAAQMLRPLGQLAFQWQFPRIQETVRSALWQLASRDNQGRLDGRLVDPGQGFKVFVIGSLVGGTHSGMFIDVAALVRSEMEALGVVADSSMIVGIGMLPGAFRGISAPNLIPNAFHALQELNSVESGTRFTHEYRNGMRVDLTHPPFDLYLVVDGVDERGRAWGSRDHLSRMLSRAVWLLAASRLGEQGDAIMDNFLALLHGYSQDGQARIFGSIGCAEIVFPAPTVIRLCAARSGRHVIARLLQSAWQERVDEDAGVWCQTLGLSPDALLGALARDENGALMAVDLAMPSFLTATPDDQTPQTAIQYVADYHRLRVQDDYRRDCWRNAETLAEAATTGLADRAENTVRTPGLGMGHAQRVLAQVAETLSAWQGQINEQRRSRLSDVAQLELEADQAADALRRAALSLWPLRRGRITSACEKYFQVSQELESARLEAMLLDRAGAVLSQVQDEARDLGREYATVDARLRAVATRLAAIERAEQQALQDQASHPLLSLVDDAMVDRLYADHNSGVDAAAQAVLATAKPTTRNWASATDDALTEAILRVASQPFNAISQVTAEQAVQWRSEISPMQRRAALLEDALPSWTYDAVRLKDGEDPHRIVLVGVEDQARSIYGADEVSSISVVSTGDPHAITALTLAAGLPVTALQAWPEWQRITESGKRNPILFSTGVTQVAPPSTNGAAQPSQA